MDSLQQIRELLRTGVNIGSLISLHGTKKDEFDFVFYRPLTGDILSNLKIIIQKGKSGRALNYSEREFNSIKIQEIASGNTIFSWVIIENVWVGSFTPFLIEDVIRTHESHGERSFKSNIAEVYQLPKMKNDAGNLYLHLPHFSKWVSLFSVIPPSEMFNKLGQSAVLDLKIEENSFVLNGFTSDSIHQSNQTLALFSKQNPEPFNLKQMISNRAAIFVSYGVSDGARLGESITRYSKNQKPLHQDSLAKYASGNSIDISKLYGTIKGEVGVSYQESKGQTLSKIMLIQTTDHEVWLKSLNTLSLKFSIDTIFFEKFSEYEIRELPLYQFPEKLFWPLVSGFNTTYYTTVGETVLMAEDLEELKHFLEDFDKEDTWGKSVNQNHFLESTLLEANISVYMNTPKLWNIVSESVHPRWKKFIEENQTLLRSLQMGAIQFSHLNESFYTNIYWSNGIYTERKKNKTSQEKIATNFSEAIRKAVVVRSHVSKSEEILVQDSAYNVSLVSADGKVLWKMPLGQPIVGEVHQVDFFKNGKLQFLFITPSALHIVDRLGNYVPPYPMNLKIKDAHWISVIDYDHSKAYRFLIASKTGKLWMYNKDGSNLEGWKPKIVEGSLLVAPQHHRIRGKDYILAIRNDGWIYLMSRRGELVKNFPLNLETKLSGSYFLETGRSVADTYFVVVSKDGYKIRFNLEGKILSRETLIKTAIDAQFSLMVERNKKSYLILRQESKQLSLFDESGKEILKNDFVGLNPVEINYYDFGAGKVYITITDLAQELSFFYDGQGKLLTSPPVESSWIDVRSGETERLKVFSVDQGTLSTQLWP
ncbi:MAG: hypothetical protein JNM57_05675 [Cyclobacteriaceae bacterium]|nr:hypothetical protein [Cyclobacteriaceae bacterium]